MPNQATEEGQLKMFAGILAIVENYIIVIIQNVFLMNGNEGRDYCCHTAFRRIIAMHE
jgi:hypothetical protein